ncbi:hypothetical protein MP638_003216 [Amoeboaphelidium occidentale]|nr:hypothetical protein MP638_003216 [Amoeboaphelidium occidentale]
MLQLLLQKLLKSLLKKYTSSLEYSSSKFLQQNEQENNLLELTKVRITAADGNGYKISHNLQIQMDGIETVIIQLIQQKIIQIYMNDIQLRVTSIIREEEESEEEEEELFYSANESLGKSLFLILTEEKDIDDDDVIKSIILQHQQQQQEQQQEEEFPIITENTNQPSSSSSSTSSLSLIQQWIQSYIDNIQLKFENILIALFENQLEFFLSDFKVKSSTLEDKEDSKDSLINDIQSKKLYKEVIVENQLSISCIVVEDGKKYILLQSSSDLSTSLIINFKVGLMEYMNSYYLFLLKGQISVLYCPDYTFMESVKVFKGLYENIVRKITGGGRNQSDSNNSNGPSVTLNISLKSLYFLQCGSKVLDISVKSRELEEDGSNNITLMMDEVFLVFIEKQLNISFGVLNMKGLKVEYFPSSFDTVEVVLKSVDLVLNHSTSVASILDSFKDLIKSNEDTYNDNDKKILIVAFVLKADVKLWDLCNSVRVKGLKYTSTAGEDGWLMELEDSLLIDNVCLLSVDTSENDYKVIRITKDSVHIPLVTLYDYKELQKIMEGIRATFSNGSSSSSSTASDSSSSPFTVTIDVLNFHYKINDTQTVIFTIEDLRVDLDKKSVTFKNGIAMDGRKILYGKSVVIQFNYETFEFKVCSSSEENDGDGLCMKYSDFMEFYKLFQGGGEQQQEHSASPSLPKFRGSIQSLVLIYDVAIPSCPWLNPVLKFRDVLVESGVDGHVDLSVKKIELCLRRNMSQSKSDHTVTEFQMISADSVVVKYSIASSTVDVSVSMLYGEVYKDVYAASVLLLNGFLMNMATMRAAEKERTKSREGFTTTDDMIPDIDDILGQLGNINDKPDSSLAGKQKKKIEKKTAAAAVDGPLKEDEFEDLGQNVSFSTDTSNSVLQITLSIALVRIILKNNLKMKYYDDYYEFYGISAKDNDYEVLSPAEFPGQQKQSTDLNKEVEFSLSGYDIVKGSSSKAAPSTLTDDSTIEIVLDESSEWGYVEKELKESDETFLSAPSTPSAKRKGSIAEGDSSVELKLNNLSIQFVKNEPLKSSPLFSNLLVKLKDFDIVDCVKGSDFYKFLTTLKSFHSDQFHYEKEFKPFLQLLLSNYDIRGSIETRVNVECIPIRAHVDQCCLAFIQEFASFQLPEKNPPDEFQIDEDDLAYIQLCTINSIHFVLDYKPRMFDVKAFTQQNDMSQLLNILPLTNSLLQLPSIRLSGISSYPKLFEQISSIYLQCILDTQLPQIISSLGPIRRMVNLGSGVGDLIILPLDQYLKKGKVESRTIRRGVSSFLKKTGVETLKIGVDLSEKLKQVLSALDSKTVLSITSSSPSSASPRSFSEGLHMGYHSLRAGLGEAVKTIVAIPMEVQERDLGGSSGFKTVVKAIPVAVLSSVFGASDALSKTLTGIRNTVETVDNEKYKRK